MAYYVLDCWWNVKIVVVTGGNYKSFYLNCFVKLRACDLLIFNYGIIYDYVVETEILHNAVVTNEYMSFQKNASNPSSFAMVKRYIFLMLIKVRQFILNTKPFV